MVFKNVKSFTESELKSIQLDDFTIIRKLGKGSIGKVYLARYNKTQQLFALKFVIFSSQATMIEGMAKSLKFRHPNLSRVYGYFRDYYKNKEYSISILEYLNGVDLFDLLMDFPERVLLNLDKIIMCTIDALEYIHGQGYVHRDIKLENIILTHDDNVKIIDYDFLISTNSLLSATTCGTPYYVSPEVLNSTYVDCRSDYWSLGVVIYLIVTGYYPFDGDTHHELFIAITMDSPDLSIIQSHSKYFNIVEGLLRKNPAERIDASQIRTILKSQEP